VKEPIERLEAELARVGAEHEPPLGWQARVLAATAARPRRRWWWLAAPMFAVAAIVVVFLVHRPRPDELALQVEIENGGPAVRGTSAHVGDRVHARVTGGSHRAVWIYRDDHELVVACPGAASCTISDAASIADFAIKAPGNYVIVALTSDAAIPMPGGSLDEDVAAALHAGAKRELRSLTVR
jgi:hypothetical protein